MKIQHQFSLLLRSILAIIGLSVLFASVPVQAQEEEEEEGSRFANAETTRVRAISEQTNRRIQPAREFLSPSAEEGQTAPEPDAAAAVRTLDGVSTGELPSHEKAEIWNLYGYAYYLLDDINKSKDYYERVVNEPDANAPLRNRTLKQIAAICLSIEDFPCSLRYIKDWIALQETVGGDDLALLGSIYFYSEDFDNAIVNMEKAIDTRESIGEIGKENWYSIQRSIYYQRNDFRKVITILEKLVVHYPHVRYWRELGGMYAELEDSENQMNAFTLAHLQKGLTTQSQLLGLAYMYIGAEVPYKGAEILSEAMEAGDVERTEKNLQLVGSAYYQARELAKALPFMEAAAESGSGGESYGRLAGIYLDLERYDDAVRTGREALRRGGIRQRHLVQMAVGTALFNQKKYDEALTAFRGLPREGPGSEPREQWIKYVGSEKRRDQQLRDSGIDLDKVLSY